LCSSGSYAHEGAFSRIFCEAEPRRRETESLATEVFTRLFSHLFG
jgi:hypothetical protein